MYILFIFILYIFIYYIYNMYKTTNKYDFPWIATTVKYYHVTKSIYKYHTITFIVKTREKLSQQTLQSAFIHSCIHSFSKYLPSPYSGNYCSRYLVHKASISSYGAYLLAEGDTQ